ncbi:hypothetical protein PYCC9005_000213 [Savitreella phatthalungensis]
MTVPSSHVERQKDLPALLRFHQALYTESPIDTDCNDAPLPKRYSSVASKADNREPHRTALQRLSHTIGDVYADGVLSLAAYCILPFHEFRKTIGVAQLQVLDMRVLEYLHDHCAVSQENENFRFFLMCCLARGRAFDRRWHVQAHGSRLPSVALRDLKIFELTLDDSAMSEWLAHQGGILLQLGQGLETFTSLKSVRAITLLCPAEAATMLYLARALCSEYTFKHLEQLDITRAELISQADFDHFWALLLEANRPRFVSLNSEQEWQLGQYLAERQFMHSSPRPYGVPKSPPYGYRIKITIGKKLPAMRSTRWVDMQLMREAARSSDALDSISHGEIKTALTMGRLRRKRQLKDVETEAFRPKSS